MNTRATIKDGGVAAGAAGAGAAAREGNCHPRRVEFDERLGALLCFAGLPEIGVWD